MTKVWRDGSLGIRGIFCCVYTLQEMLTVKSDDVIWRNKMYESIIKWQKPNIWWLPESFNLVTYLFKWLSQNIKPVTHEELEEIKKERVNKIKNLWLSKLMNDSVASDEDIENDSVESKEEKGKRRYNR